MTALRLEKIGHAYFGRTVLDAVDLTVAKGEIVSLVGPSGCGKSTLLHIAAGVVEPLRGRVTANYEQHGVVFQDTRLMPWARAIDNIAYPLRIGGVARGKRAERARAVAQDVGFDESDLAKYPVELSGGMKQRVSIARALALAPDFVYFDEPFTALDVALKRRMQNLVIDAAKRSGFAALFVTHDLSEAVRISHTIAVMDAHGRGIAGKRGIPGAPAERDERMIFETVMGYLNDDPLFRHVNDVDERRVS